MCGKCTRLGYGSFELCERCKRESVAIEMQKQLEMMPTRRTLTVSQYKPSDAVRKSMAAITSTWQTPTGSSCELNDIEH
jgi:hypothetical protein